MKKRTHLPIVSISILVLSIVFIQSCIKTPTPVFTYEPSTNPEAGDSIKFTNASLDATSYEWDFGDNYTSTEEHPSNIYVEAATYTVTLTASNEKKSEMISEVIEINETTVLACWTVEDDENDTIVIDACSVWVYDNEFDWENTNDPQFESLTDVDGLALFMNLEDQEYIVDLYKETEAGVWYAAYLLEALTLNELNGYILPMTFYPDTKKSTLRSARSNTSLSRISKSVE